MRYLESFLPIEGATTYVLFVGSSARLRVHNDYSRGPASTIAGTRDHSNPLPRSGGAFFTESPARPPTPLFLIQLSLVGCGPPLGLSDLSTGAPPFGASFFVQDARLPLTGGGIISLPLTIYTARVPLGTTPRSGGAFF